jgi:hypothetical protein
MSDAEFRKFVDDQFRKADQAGREADFRRQLGGGKNDSTKDKSTSTKDQKEERPDE